LSERLFLNDSKYVEGQQKEEGLYYMGGAYILVFSSEMEQI
jgi:hypothetical protein